MTVAVSSAGDGWSIGGNHRPRSIRSEETQRSCVAFSPVLLRNAVPFGIEELGYAAKSGVAYTNV